MRRALPVVVSALALVGALTGPATAADPVSSFAKADPARDQVAAVGYRDADRAHWSAQGWTVSPASAADFVNSTYRLSGTSGSRVITITHGFRNVLARTNPQQQTVYTTLWTGKGLNATVQSSNLGTGIYVYLDGRLRSCPDARTVINTTTKTVRQIVPLSCWAATTFKNPRATSLLHSTSEAKDVARDAVAAASVTLR